MLNVHFTTNYLFIRFSPINTFCYKSILGCKLFYNNETHKIQEIHIPTSMLDCNLTVSKILSTVEYEVNCLIINFRELDIYDKVKSYSDDDTIIFDTINDKIVRIEIIGYSDKLSEKNKSI